ncbi:hypothetical protein BHM03_00047265 [Ensete ventricosum]|nr:hypothetical protein BHM03_00047265 [Ensete ventricosum]
MIPAKTNDEQAATCQLKSLGRNDLSGRRKEPCSVHGRMFRVLHAVVCKVLEIFPLIEAARPRSESGIQALSCLILSLFVSSGQTYERFCIEKWYNDGHSTCPKAQQQLSHLCLTPNYCVKRLIVSWCERNGFPIPNGPPESLDVNYWRLAFSKCQAINTNSFGYTSSCKLKCDKVLPLEENLNREELRENDAESLDNHYHDCGLDEFEKYGSLLSALHEAESAQKQFRIVEQIKNLLKEDDEARIFMGTNGAVEVLIQFLRMAVHIGDEKAQEAGAMALFNLMVNSNR